MTKTPDPILPPAADEDYEVAMAIVPAGRAVTWEPGEWVPDRVLWLQEDEWWWLAEQSPRLRRLDLYSSQRVDQMLCRKMLNDLEGSKPRSPPPGSRPILSAAIALLAECIETPGAELMIEGP